VEPATRDVHELLLASGATIAVAESLTGGLLGAELTSVPGSSATFLGGITAYASVAKTSLLGVSADLLALHGAVHPDVAAAMAHGVRARFGSTYAVALTGVAGPDPQDGQPPGTVFVALVGAGPERMLALALSGGRVKVRRDAVRAALALVVQELDSSLDAGGKTEA
jgi:nicotinamide-nucleotide amidase